MSSTARMLDFIDFIGVKKNSFYKQTGLSNGYLDKVKELGSDKIASIISSYPQLNLTWLITGKGEMISYSSNESNSVSEPLEVYGLRTDHNIEHQRIPLYNIEAAAGIVQLFSHQHADKPIDYLHIPGIPKCDGAVYVTGDSMYPLLKSGDIAMYKEIKDLSTAIFFWGEMYLIAVDNDGDEFVVVKYVQKSDLGSEYIKLVSYNQHHAPVDIHKSKIKALALVKGSVRINSMG